MPLQYGSERAFRATTAAELAAATGDVAALQGDVTTAQGDISALQTSVSNLEAAVAAIPLSSIKNIYRGTIDVVMNFVAANSATATITAVDLDKTVIHFLGWSTTVQFGDWYFARVALTNATTVTAYASRQTANSGVTVTVGYCVVEYN